MQVDECNISINLGNNLNDSMHCFWVIAHGKREKNIKNYKSTGGSWKEHYNPYWLPGTSRRAKMAWKTCYV